MFQSMLSQRCPKCQSRLFISRDPMDEPGTVYCLAGHTFVPAGRPANRTGARPRAVVAVAARAAA
ncbi:MAG: hypothetical protein IT302_00605 [Dehalococcoidia bacterium]|nr:hypothetical protein [Dehalococcoidia bacterium]